MIDVIIPTINRHDKIMDLYHNVRAATLYRHKVTFVAEVDDVETVGVLEANQTLMGFNFIVGSFGSCAAAMNAGYNATEWPFLFTGNDDLRFHRGWDTEALFALDQPGKQICGTNDGNNRMTCFAMVRRYYIMQESGVFDVPNQLYHEYVSQYCDTELAEYAKHRGSWTEAPKSHTEHLHWEFGKAEREHPNYLKAQATVGQDRATYEQRRLA